MSPRPPRADSSGTAKSPRAASPPARPAAPLESLRARAARCRDCPLWQPATQTVFGAGSAGARLMLVGEQPGQQEDLSGQPFVGPAGKLLDRALAEAGIDRGLVYVTNAVKHFKYALRGKRRLHRTPAQREIEACHQWLEQELALVDPALVVALGATAVQALLGKRLPIGRHRGQWFETDDHSIGHRGIGRRRVFITVHPSYLLRVPDEDKAAAYAQFVDELRLVTAALAD